METSSRSNHDDLCQVYKSKFHPMCECGHEGVCSCAFIHHDALIFWSILILFAAKVDGDTNKTHMWMKYQFFVRFFSIVVYTVNIDASIGKGCWLVCWTMMRHRLHQQQRHDNSIIPDDIGKMWKMCAGLYALLFHSLSFSHHRHHSPIKFTVCQN